MGYKLRFQDHSRPEGLIKLMTDGILLAETQGDRFLDAYDTIIVDEAHERSLNIDFLLGYLKWLLPKRPGSEGGHHLGDHRSGALLETLRRRAHHQCVGSQLSRSRCATAPVELDEEDDETAADEQAAILSAVDELWREQAGDILVFLSGEREIRETAESLRKHHPQDCEVLPLYSRLSQEEQQRVFRPCGPAPRRARHQCRRDFADGARHPRGDRHRRGAHQPLQPPQPSAAAAHREDLAGLGEPALRPLRPRRARASRSACIRKRISCARPEFTEPEIQRTNLAAVILQMHALKLGDIEAFPFVEPPDGRYVRDGQRTLRELGALVRGGRSSPTSAGSSPNYRSIRASAACCWRRPTSTASRRSPSSPSALSVPDPRDRPADKQTQADQKHAPLRDEQSDFLSLLKLWRACDEAARAAVARASCAPGARRTSSPICGSPNGTTCTARSWKW